LLEAEYIAKELAGNKTWNALNVVADILFNEYIEILIPGRHDIC
jgi:hypothetical protein